MNIQRDLFNARADLTSLPSAKVQVCQLVAKITEGHSRDRVADDMSQLGHKTSRRMIDAWASATRENHNIPFYQVPALQVACDSTLLTDWEVALQGGIACYGEEALRREVAAELAELEYRRSEFTRRINALRKAHRS